MVISPTASWIRWCMQVYAWWFNLDLSCLGRTIYDRQFWVPSQRFNSATGEQKGITQTIYIDSGPPSRMPNSLMPSAKLRSANLPFLRLWCDAVGDRPWPPAPRADALTTVLRGDGKVHMRTLQKPTQAESLSRNGRPPRVRRPLCVRLFILFYQKSLHGTYPPNFKTFFFFFLLTSIFFSFFIFTIL